jgi:hypothetical protein
MVTQSLGGKEDHPGALDLKIRQRIFACTPVQLVNLHG